MFRYDPLRRVPGRLRLLLGAALCLAPMGMVWKIGDGYYLPGSMDWGDCGYDDDGNYLCNPTEYTPGTFHMGSAELVAQSPVRVFLVFALVGLPSRLRADAPSRRFAWPGWPACPSAARRCWPRPTGSTAP